MCLCATYMKPTHIAERIGIEALTYTGSSALPASCRYSQLVPQNFWSGLSLRFSAFSLNVFAFLGSLVLGRGATPTSTTVATKK